MPTDRLIFCRTPLQALVAAAVMRSEPARDTLVYQPTSASPKHRHYFDRLSPDRGVFLSYVDERRSHFAAEWRSYFLIPRDIRRRHFDAYLVSSFDSLVFALLARTRREAPVATFDDGSMSLIESEITSRVEGESRLHRVTKRLAGTHDNRTLINDADPHYTIYPPDRLVLGRGRARPVALFDIDGRPLAGKKPITVMLGWPASYHGGTPGSEMLRRYLQVLDRLDADIVLPHPAEQLPVVVRPDLPNAAAIHDWTERMIAEDLVLHLVAAGYVPVVWGIDSSALINLAGLVETVNIVLGDRSVSTMFTAFGVAERRWDEVAAR